VSTANVTDRDGAIDLATECQVALSCLDKMLVDGGYSGPKFADKIKELIKAEVEVAKRSELHTFKVIPVRWVVERSLSWLEKCRRLWKNCERKLTTSKQMIVLAFLALILKRF
jgi:transposase